MLPCRRPGCSYRAPNRWRRWFLMVPTVISAEASGPIRVSLPSMFPPGLTPLATWDTDAGSRWLPCSSACIETTVWPTKMIAITATIAYPCRLVDDGHPLGHVAVAGNDLSGHHDAEVAGPQLGGRDLFGGAVRPEHVGDGFLPAAAQGVGLRLAPAFGHRLGEVGEQHGRPQPQRDQPDEHVRPVEKLDRGDHAADLDHEHDRDVHHLAGIELDERLAGGAAQDRRLEQRTGRPGAHLGRPGLRRRCRGGGPGRDGLLAHVGLPGSRRVSAASSSCQRRNRTLAIMWSRTRTIRPAATKNATTVAIG